MYGQYNIYKVFAALHEAGIQFGQDIEFVPEMFYVRKPNGWAVRNIDETIDPSGTKFGGLVDEMVDVGDAHTCLFKTIEEAEEYAQT